MITILISCLLCCASNARAASVSGYVDVIRGFKLTSLRDKRLMASAKQPGVYRTVPDEKMRKKGQPLDRVLTGPRSGCSIITPNEGPQTFDIELLGSEKV